MSNNIYSYRTALNHFGQASYDLFVATAKLPFSGGWKRLVVFGLPVLLLFSGTGALIFAVMVKTLRAAGKSLSDNYNALYKKFYRSRTVTHRANVPFSQPLPQHVQQAIHQNTQLEPKPRTPSPQPQLVAPLPIDAAKERNQSLLKLLELIEKFVIDPLIIKKKFCFGLPDMQPQEVKNWLMSMTLWRLGLTWDQLQSQYVKMKTPPPPTKESIVLEAKRIDSRFGDLFDQIGSSGQLPPLMEEITKSVLDDHKKMRLTALYFQLYTILQPAPNTETKASEDQEIQKQFALIMNNGMANTLTQMTGIIEGWMKVINMPSVTLPLMSSDENEQASANGNQNPSQLTKLIGDIFGKVGEDLTKKYLMPLWDKKYKGWDASVNDALKKELRDRNTDVFDQFMKGEIDEKKFLENAESQTISTSLVSFIFFVKAMQAMGRDRGKFEKVIQSTLGSVLAQLQPTLVDTLTKSADMLAQISFERTVPKVVDYFIELLKCCTTMQSIREGSSLETSVSSENFGFTLLPVDSGTLKKNLEGAEISSQDAEGISRLCSEASLHISGKKIIESLPKNSVHRVVHLSFDSSIYERTWIGEKKEKLKGILKLRAEKYAQQEGNWISNLLKTQSTDKPTSFVSLLLGFSNKLREIPGLDGVITFLFSGVEAVIENKACDATQSFLNDLTSTGYISTIISTSVVKSLLAKDDSKWNKNLKTLQRAYFFLQPDEKQVVLKHLAIQCEKSVYEKRKIELENSNSISDEQKGPILAMQEKENAYKKAADLLLKTIGEVDKKPGKPGLQKLVETYEKLKREKELQQFYRARTLATFVADEFLKEFLTFTGGDTIRNICIKVLHEGLTLLTCQEIVKHWIFTLVDLIISELEENGSSQSNTSDSKSNESKSILDFIDETRKPLLLDSLTSFLKATEKDKGWTSASAWLVWGAGQVTSWSPETIWNLVTPYSEKLKITPVMLKDAALEWLGDYGKDPNGLSDVIIQALTEHVADPRPESVVNMKEEQI